MASIINNSPWNHAKKGFEFQRFERRDMCSINVCTCSNISGVFENLGNETTCKHVFAVMKILFNFVYFVGRSSPFQRIL